MIFLAHKLLISFFLSSQSLYFQSQYLHIKKYVVIFIQFDTCKLKLYELVSNFWTRL